MKKIIIALFIVIVIFNDLTLLNKLGHYINPDIYDTVNFAIIYVFVVLTTYGLNHIFSINSRYTIFIHNMNCTAIMVYGFLRSLGNLSNVIGILIMGVISLFQIYLLYIYIKKNRESFSITT